MKSLMSKHIIGNIFNISIEYDNQTWSEIQVYIYSQVVHCYTIALEHIIIALLVYFIVCLILYRLIFLSNCQQQNSHENNKDAITTVTATPAVVPNTIWNYFKINNVRLSFKQNLERVLFVISHPDDECMFFGPLIYCLSQRPNTNIYILCLSFGNYENKASIRREELWRSCAILGIPASHITIVNATYLPDDPNVEWKIDAVASLVLGKVESLDINAIFTFDRDGVSQHPNHCALYYAVASLYLTNALPKSCKFFVLDTINTMRKYLSVFDLLCTCLMSTNWFILNWEQATIVRNAMKAHKSQMKWFRWLYIYFSRYIFINSAREIDLADIELEMQIY